MDKNKETNNITPLTFCTKEHIAEYIRQEKAYLCSEIKKFINQGHIRPRLLIIQIGNNQTSNRYVKGKISDANEIGIEPTLMQFSESVTYEEFTDFLLKQREDYHGIIIQLPLPEHLQLCLKDIQTYIKPHQDVDGFRIDSFYYPCTPKGIVEYLTYSKGKDWLRGKHAIIVGRSDLVGRPLAKMLLDCDCTVTVCHSKTRHLKATCRNADILISAVGKANIIDKTFIKNTKTAVINVGFDFVNGKMVGDIDIDSVSEVTKLVTPIIGGTGLLTRLALMQNTFKAYLMQENME